MVVESGPRCRKKSLTGGFRSRVELALSLGVAPRRLDGWEPAEVTDYEYDGDRLVRAVTRRESEFDDRQVAILLAAVELGKDVGPHGIPITEATDPQNSLQLKRKDPSRPRGHYRAVGPVTDYAEEALQMAKADHYRDKPDDYDRSADLWSVEWVPDK